MSTASVVGARSGRRVRPPRWIAGLALAAGVGSPALADWDDDPWADDPWDEEEQWLPFEVDGFVEIAGGHHTRDNQVLDKDYNLAEARLRLEARGDWRRFDFRVRGDGVADQVKEEIRGELREARVAFPVGQRLDMRVGRQVLAWGTGDLLFINDLFPKDFNSFLTGRDEDYLQGPSDAVRGTWYGDNVTLDLVWTPVFEPDDYPNGERLSYFDLREERQTEQSPPADDPDSFPDDGELAARLTHRIGSAELAGYFYRGFFPQPEEQANDRLTHARLNAYGASIRDRLGPGIANAEVGYYDSVDNRDGDRSVQVPNSEFRALLGYTWEAATNFDVGLQYYLEWLQDYDDLEARWQADDDLLPEEYRQVLTTRLTYSVWRDNLIGSLFAFYSPDDEDYYLRPSVRYRASDALSYSVGGNLFGGDSDHTFYGQFKRDSNLYARVRYRF
ncbi:hypothetical protein [Halorhodospira halophila]|uniref:Uncharacterized protein n=1 Tax=Halorhodospira halophila (strain DSM 244 / SL1) TaxID=349124 RepID=A1WWX9_HALHL|nr:hypothetical protein [Halorhodospira halophila]ABM62191.1 conserved hypothetical protein [Halorhodospira halophila SL1]MBK1729166.1 hypothetical protein [Halorhodospira halophila]